MNKKPLIIALGGPWRSLDPGLQHTYWADVLLKNQFEPLVGRTLGGIPAPSVARTWSIDASFRKFTFRLDPNKKFSDGSPVLASSFKVAWERSLRLVPNVDNGSLLDMAYMLEGFSEFESRGHISGIVPEDPTTLTIHFSRPFRMALFYLSGSRAAVYKTTPGGFLGSGPYEIHELAPNRVALRPNPYFAGTPPVPVEVYHDTPQSILTHLEDGETDVISAITGSAIPESTWRSHQVSAIPGPFSSHRVGYVNSHTGSKCFRTRELRQAFQYAVWTALRESPVSIGTPELVPWDPQIYLQGQHGRLPESKAIELVNKGKEHLVHLVECTRERPLRLWMDDNLRSIGLGLNRLGVRTEVNRVDIGNYFPILASPERWDVIFGGFSIPHADPDGVYHALGRNGSILERVTYQDSVGDLLESGRSLLSASEMDGHYRSVATEVLRSVPIVHLGFTRSAALIRSDRVDVRNEALQRGEAQFDAFSLK
ncbi:MAG: hypothetical protein IT285_10965 [Bdellovibrionales bacterium]|nr:hypothetical protein [Bdellovibrionales bacterium]